MELGELGDQPGPPALPTVGADRGRCLGRRPDGPTRHRDPRRGRPEPAHPVLPAPGARLPSPVAAGPLSWSTAFPPVVWWLLLDHRRCNLHREEAAELPQLLRRPGVLEENVIDLEGVNRAGTVAIDGLPNAGDKVSQLRLVVLRDHGARCSSLRLAGHEYEATQSPASQRHYLMGSRGPRHDRAPAGAIRPRHGEARLTVAAANAWVGALPSTPDDLA